MSFRDVQDTGVGRKEVSNMQEYPSNRGIRDLEVFEIQECSRYIEVFDVQKYSRSGGVRDKEVSEI